MNEEKGTDFKGWVLLLIIVLVPAYIIYNSTKTAYPGMLDLIGGALVITAGTALWMHWNSNEPDAEVRRAGLVVMALLAIFGGLNVWAHVTLTRDISAAEEAKKEFRDQVGWEQTQKDREANRRLKLAEGQAQVMSAQKDLALAEARRLNSLPPSQRRFVPRANNNQLLVSPELTAPPEDAVTEPKPTEGPATVVPMTDAEVRNERRGMIVFLLMCEMLTAIAGGAWVQGKKNWDGNRNGVPDFVERIYAHSPDYVQQRWPRFFDMLKQPAQPAMGNV